MLREPAHQPGRLDPDAAASLHWPGSASGTPAWVPGSSNTSQQASAALELAVVAAIADDGVAAGLAAAGADPPCNGTPRRGPTIVPSRSCPDLLALLVTPRDTSLGTLPEP